MTKRSRRTDRRARTFLDALRRGSSVGAACAAAGIARQTAYAWRLADAAFKAAWDDAYEDGTDVLEDEALRRALEGVLEPVVSAGKLVQHEGEPLFVRKFSDAVLLATLKRRRSAWRDRSSLEHSGRLDLTGSREALDRKLAGLAASLGAATLSEEPE